MLQNIYKYQWYLGVAAVHSNVCALCNVLNWKIWIQTEAHLALWSFIHSDVDSNIEF